MKNGFVKCFCFIASLLILFHPITVKASGDTGNETDVTSQFQVWYTVQTDSSMTSSAWMTVNPDRTFVINGTTTLNELRIRLVPSDGFKSAYDYRVEAVVKCSENGMFYGYTNTFQYRMSDDNSSALTGYESVTSSSVTALTNATSGSLRNRNQLSCLFPGKEGAQCIVRVPGINYNPDLQFTLQVVDVHVYEISKTEGAVSGILGILQSLGGWFQSVISAIVNLPGNIFSQFQAILSNIKGAIDSVVSAVTSLPGLIMDGLKQLFIPDSDMITDVFQDWNVFLEDKFGILFLPIRVVESVIYPVITGQGIERIENEGTMLPYEVFENYALSGTSGSGFRFPAFSITLSGATYQLWESQVVDIEAILENAGLGWLIQVITFITSAFLCFQFLRWLISFLAREFPNNGLFGQIEAFYDNFLSGFDGNIFKGVF